MLLEDFRPQTKLVTQNTRLDRPRFPVVDAHNHLGEPFGGGWDKKPINLLLDLLDEAGVIQYVDLDGGWGEEILDHHLDYFKAKAPDRFMVFGGIDWSQWGKIGEGFPEWAAIRLRKQKERGAQGLKIWKGFGLHVRDERGNLVSVDDQRLAPIWETTSELGLPVMIHVADPVAFFDPLNETNERWEELHAHPDWHFPHPTYPAFMTIIKQFANLILGNPHTTFIGAHVGCYAENLTWVSELLDHAPNFYVDISARISELGRQPYAARRFFLKYADHILFGTDMGPDLDTYRIYYRFLESEDEYFSYSKGEVPEQGRWHIYGLYLPDDVLEKVYYHNATRLFGLKGDKE
jgi:predicted TIM-barrel fold metal-dependent hydrolase